jgi:hypothetical protein
VSQPGPIKRFLTAAVADRSPVPILEKKVHTCALSVSHIDLTGIAAESNDQRNEQDNDHYRRR